MHWMQPGNDQLCYNGSLPSSFKGVFNWTNEDTSQAASLSACVSVGAWAGAVSCPAASELAVCATGGNTTDGQKLLNFSQSFTNFAAVAQANRFFGWSQARRL